MRSAPVASAASAWDEPRGQASAAFRDGPHGGARGKGKPVGHPNRGLALDGRGQPRFLYQWVDAIAGSHALLLVTFRPEYQALDLELLLSPDSIGAAWDALTRCSSSIFPLGDERVEIFKIHPRRRGIDPSKFDLGELVDFTKD